MNAKNVWRSEFNKFRWIIWKFVQNTWIHFLSVAKVVLYMPSLNFKSCTDFNVALLSFHSKMKKNDRFHCYWQQPICLLWPTNFLPDHHSAWIDLIERSRLIHISSQYYTRSSMAIASSMKSRFFLILHRLLSYRKLSMQR